MDPQKSTTPFSEEINKRRKINAEMKKISRDRCLASDPTDFYQIDSASRGVEVD